MKVVCNNCGSKYSIPDEKVSGKAFKTRCKKCDSTIVVRGDQISTPPPQSSTPSQEETTRIFRTDTNDVWHVVVEEDQQGPFGISKIHSLIKEGTIDWGAYVWREGMDGWKPMAQAKELVEELQKLGAMPPVDQVHQGSIDDEIKQSFASLESTSSNASPPSEYPTDPSKLASRSSSESGPDLFAEAEDLSTSATQAKQERISSPRVSTDDALTGQRNENSVLFSLDSLKSRTDKTEETKAPKEEKVVAPVVNPTSDESSGLIDIKSLASVAGGSNPSVSGFSSSSSISDSRLLAPPEKKKGKGGVFVGMLLVLLLLGGGVGALHFLKIIDLSGLKIAVVANPAQEPPQTPPENPVQPEPVAELPEPEPAEEPTAEQPPATELEQKVAEPAVEPPPAKKEVEKPKEEPKETKVASASSSTRGRKKGRGSNVPTQVKKETPVERKPASDSPKKEEKKDIATLMKNAAGVKNGVSGSSSDNLPNTPSRSDILNGMKTVQSSVSNCGQGSRGIAKVKVTISGSSGRVKNALVSGQFAGTTVGSCVAREVRKARFSKFKQSTFEVSFPFRI